MATTNFQAAAQPLIYQPIDSIDHPKLKCHYENAVSESLRRHPYLVIPIMAFPKVRRQVIVRHWASADQIAFIDFQGVTLIWKISVGCVGRSRGVTPIPPKIIDIVYPIAVVWLSVSGWSKFPGHMRKWLTTMQVCVEGHATGTGQMNSRW